MASKVVIFIALACLSSALIGVESGRDETFLERVQRAYTRANSEYHPRTNQLTNYYQIPDELKESTRSHGWELEHGTNPVYRPQEINGQQESPLPDETHGSTTNSLQHQNTRDATTQRFIPESNRQYETREALVHHTIPSSMRHNTREETVQSMGAGNQERTETTAYMHREADTKQRVQSTFMHPDAAGEASMPQEIPKEAIVRHTFPESMPQETAESWSHTKRMPQGTNKWAQTGRTLPTSMPQYTTRHTWAQGKRATTTAMLQNGMGGGGYK